LPAGIFLLTGVSELEANDLHLILKLLLQLKLLFYLLALLLGELDGVNADIVDVAAALV